jgi:hypothetical protein
MHILCVKNWDAMSIDGVISMNLPQSEVLGDNIEDSDVKVFVKPHSPTFFFQYHLIILMVIRYK